MAIDLKPPAPARAARSWNWPGWPWPRPGSGRHAAPEPGGSVPHAACGADGSPAAQGTGRPAEPRPVAGLEVPPGRVMVGRDAVAEPLPGGVWIRPRGTAVTPEAGVAGQGQWLARHLARRPDRLSVVLGRPGREALRLDAVREFWDRLPAHHRTAVRFVRYGPVGLAARQRLGQELADLLDHPVVVCTGLTVAAPDSPPGGVPRSTGGDDPRMHVVRPDGTLGWRPFVLELGYLPRGAGAQLPAALLRHRPPIPGLAPLSPGAYRYAADAVLEVLPSGLWLRPDAVPPHAVPPGATDLRALPPDPGGARFFVGDGSPGSAERMRPLAMAAWARLDRDLRDTCRVLPAGGQGWVAEPLAPAPAAVPTAVPTAVPGEAPAAVPAGQPPEPAQPPARESTPPPAGDQQPSTVDYDGAVGETPAGGLPAIRLESGPPAPPDSPAPEAGTAPEAVRAQPVPAAAAAAVPPARGTGREREWLRANLTRAYDAEAGRVARVLSGTPGLHAAGRDPADTLTDLVAVRLYATGALGGLDDAVRAGRVGGHVPVARCVAAGLRLLPSYRGLTVLHARLSPAQWRWYEDRRVVTEWAFCSALTGAGRSDPGAGAARVLIWSLTARRTDLIDARQPGRVVFGPGTSFKVLRVDAAHRLILLRELSAAEIGPQGQIELGQVPLDELAIAAERAGREAETGPDAGAAHHGAAHDGAAHHGMGPAAAHAVPPGLLRETDEEGDPAMGDAAMSNAAMSDAATGDAQEVPA